MKNGFNEAGIRAAIEEFLTEDVTKEGGFFNKEFSDLKEKGIIKNIADNGDVLFNTGVVDIRVTSSSKVNNTEFLNETVMIKEYELFKRNNEKIVTISALLSKIIFSFNHFRMFKFLIDNFTEKIINPNRIRRSGPTRIS